MLLQYPVQFHLFADHGRLNPEDTPLEEAGDCGANALFLLGLISEKEATALSIQQNKCWSTKSGIETTPFYLFQTYLFTDHSKQYEIVGWPKEDVMNEVNVLENGYGTFIFMKKTDSKLGHYLCFFKENEEIQLADLQTEEIIKNDEYEPDRLDTYLRKYDLFFVPYVLEKTKAESTMYRTPTKTGSKVKPASEESVLYSHGSPSEMIPKQTEDIENLHARTPRTPLASKVRSPLTPLTPQPKKKRGGTRRKRRTRKMKKN